MAESSVENTLESEAQGGINNQVKQAIAKLGEIRNPHESNEVSYTPIVYSAIGFITAIVIVSAAIVLANQSMNVGLPYFAYSSSVVVGLIWAYAGFTYGEEVTKV